MAGTIFGAVIGGFGNYCTMNLVIHIVGNTGSVSTLGAGCTLGTDGVTSQSSSDVLQLQDTFLCYVSLMSHDVSICSRPLMALAQSARACINLSRDTMVGFVVYLC